MTGSGGYPRRRGLAQIRDLIRELVSRDMKLRYKRSVLGIGWSLLNPLAQLLVYRFIFGTVLPLNIPNYSSFLFTGVLAWSWFHSSLLLATGAIVENRDLVKRPGFPASVLPVVAVTSHFVHFLLALPILFLFLRLDGRPWTVALLALPLVIAVQFAFTVSLGFLVSILHVRFRDTQYLLEIALQLMFFLTPIFYDTTVVPARYHTLYRLNPMVEVLGAYRAILLRGELPSERALLALAGVAAGILAIAYALFRKASHRFVEEL